MFLYEWGLQSVPHLVHSPLHRAHKLFYRLQELLQLDRDCMKFLQDLVVLNPAHMADRCYLLILRKIPKNRCYCLLMIMFQDIWEPKLRKKRQAKLNQIYKHWIYWHKILQSPESTSKLKFRWLSEQRIHNSNSSYSDWPVDIQYISQILESPLLIHLYRICSFRLLNSQSHHCMFQLDKAHNFSYPIQTGPVK